MTTFLEEMTEKYVSGKLSEVEFRQLEECLSEDPAARRRLLETCSMEMELPALLREKQAPARIPRWRSRKTLALAASIGGLLFGVWVLRKEETPASPSMAAATATPQAGLIAVVTPVPEPESAVQPEIVDTPPVEEIPARFFGKLSKTEGAARITGADGTLRDLPETAETIELQPNEQLALNRHVEAELELSDGTQLHLHGGTRLRLSGDAETPVVFLDGGGVDVDMDGRREELPLPKFLTAFMDVRAENTEFRLLSVNDSSWVALRKGEARITRLSDGNQVMLAEGNYAAAHPTWPFQVMWAAHCPMWKSLSKHIAGDEYP